MKALARVPFDQERERERPTHRERETKYTHRKPREEETEVERKMDRSRGDRREMSLRCGACIYLVLSLWSFPTYEEGHGFDINNAVVATYSE